MSLFIQKNDPRVDFNTYLEHSKEDKCDLGLLKYGVLDTGIKIH
jgi:hypothetical protein